MKRAILIAGIGNSPQVLTEMVWEMVHLATPVLPDEIVALAAKSSAEKLKATLFDGGERSVWAGLLAALKREKVDISGKLRFGTASIAVLPDSGGNEMQDLRSGDDSLSAADFILSQLRRFTESPDTIVYASIAGGRKTMSALMFSCMTLLGREEDKIVHVLPPVELEGGSDGVPRYVIYNAARDAGNPMFNLSRDEISKGATRIMPNDASMSAVLKSKAVSSQLDLGI